MNLERTSTRGKYQITISENIEDPRWDAFVACAPGGHYVQTSLWGQLKETQGWRALRPYLSDRGIIVAGGQILINQFPLIGTICYITKGPILIKNDPMLFRQFIHELSRLSHKLHIRYLVVQPPNNGHSITHELCKVGFQKSWIELAPTASIVLDLDQNLDNLLSQMKRQTRQNIMQGQRKGVVVREGTRADLNLFYKLYTSTSIRQRFTPYPKTYFAKMWDLFNHAEGLQILIAEYDGEAVSTLLIMPFGTSVIAKVIGWSGERSNCKPNHSVIWGAIQWSKSHGYRFFDFEGIDLIPAQTILNNKHQSHKKILSSTDFFKIGFGGKIVVYPEPYDYVNNRWLRIAYSRVSPRLRSWPVVYKKLLDYIRNS